MRREVAKCYGTKGNVSEDPVVIMKMMLLLFLDNVRSERELMRIIPERLDYLWFLGYGLDDTIPNQQRLGPLFPIPSEALQRYTVFHREIAAITKLG